VKGTTVRKGTIYEFTEKWNKHNNEKSTGIFVREQDVEISSVLVLSSRQLSCCDAACCRDSMGGLHLLTAVPF